MRPHDAIVRAISKTQHGQASVNLSWSRRLAGLCFLLCAAAPAAEPPPAHPLSLAELTALALRNNPQTRAAWASLAQSQAAEKIAAAGYWPTVNASFSAQRLRSLAAQGNSVAAQTRLSPSLSLSWLLFDFGSRGGSADQAAANVLVAQYGLNQSLQDLALSVESGYYSLLGQRALSQAHQQSLDEAQANLDAAQTKHKAGLATVADVYQAQAALAAAQLSLQQSQGNARIAQGALAVAAGYAPDTLLQLTDWQADATQARLPATTLEQLLTQARGARSELLAAQASEQAAAAAVRIARGDALPKLNLSGSAGQTRILDVGTSRQYSAAATLSVPLFAGGALHAAIAQARAAQDLAQANRETVLRSVEQAVWSAWQNMQTAYSGLASSRLQEQAAQRAAEAIRARYQNGLSSMLDLLSSEATLAQARVTRIQAALDWYTALATLAHNAGGLRLPDEATAPGVTP
ncbi:type I secretion outer membrane protein, TolC family [Solimonas aquatica]|uniref:Protein CyaE n=1 Tax=Solimonas aquatica TaxID=489703 RepID=A0A1H9I524_9GAMM|nr:type I secretion outer membrane protein, TolC family [Solimonas aquatica]